MFNNSAFGSIHQDVLNATPDSQEAKLRLVEEIKSRAKGSVSNKNWPEAITLYSKGIELLPEDATLYANRSMCYLNMNNGVDALNDANDAIDKDNNYAKGYYRKAMALVNLKIYEDARKTLEEGLLYAPGDSSFLTQLEKVKALCKGDSTPVSPTPSNVNKATPASTSSSKSTSTTSAPKPKSEKVVIEDEVGKNENLRGYKKTADGRVTTFFNKEIDEQTKALIGDIAPKKIEAMEVAENGNANTTGASVWNSAGTWEEKVHTPWALSRMKELIENVRFKLPGSIDEDEAVIVKSASVSGDAQVTINRSKVKHIYDLTVDLDWKMETEFGTIAGSIKIEDITAEKEYEFSVQKSSKSGETSSDSRVEALYKKYIYAKNDGIQVELRKALAVFDAEFMQK